MIQIVFEQSTGCLLRRSVYFPIRYVSQLLSFQLEGIGETNPHQMESEVRSAHPQLSSQTRLRTRCTVVRRVLSRNCSGENRARGRYMVSLVRKGRFRNGARCSLYTLALKTEALPFVLLVLFSRDRWDLSFVRNERLFIR
jgi:hypothetical protein